MAKHKPTRPSPLQWTPCPKCAGQGYVLRSPCGKCNGKGRALVNTASAAAADHDQLLRAFRSEET